MAAPVRPAAVRPAAAVQPVGVVQAVGVLQAAGALAADRPAVVPVVVLSVVVLSVVVLASAVLARVGAALGELEPREVAVTQLAAGVRLAAHIRRLAATLGDAPEEAAVTTAVVGGGQITTTNSAGMAIARAAAADMAPVAGMAVVAIRVRPEIMARRETTVAAVVAQQPTRNAAGMGTGQCVVAMIAEAAVSGRRRARVSGVVPGSVPRAIGQVAHARQPAAGRAETARADPAAGRREVARTELIVRAAPATGRREVARRELIVRAAPATGRVAAAGRAPIVRNLIVPRAVATVRSAQPANGR